MKPFFSFCLHVSTFGVHERHVRIILYNNPFYFFIPLSVFFQQIPLSVVPVGIFESQLQSAGSHMSVKQRQDSCEPQLALTIRPTETGDLVLAVQVFVVKSSYSSLVQTFTTYFRVSDQARHTCCMQCASREPVLGSQRQESELYLAHEPTFVTDYYYFYNMTLAISQSQEK